MKSSGSDFGISIKEGYMAGSSAFWIEDSKIEITLSKGKLRIVESKTSSDVICFIQTF